MAHRTIDVKNEEFVKVILEALRETGNEDFSLDELRDKILSKEIYCTSEELMRQINILIANNKIRPEIVRSINDRDDEQACYIKLEVLD